MPQLWLHCCDSRWTAEDPCWFQWAVIPRAQISKYGKLLLIVSSLLSGLLFCSCLSPISSSTASMRPIKFYLFPLISVWKAMNPNRPQFLQSWQPSMSRLAINYQLNFLLIYNVQCFHASLTQRFDLMCDLLAAVFYPSYTFWVDS